MSNPYIFSQVYPDRDISDYTAEEAYELGVDAGLQNNNDTHKHDFSSIVSVSGCPQCKCGKVLVS